MSEHYDVSLARSVSPWGNGRVPINVRPPASVATGPVVFFILGADKVSEAVPTKPKSEDRLYVLRDAVSRTASIAVLLISIVSLALWLISGFILLNPFLSLLTAMFALLFFGMTFLRLEGPNESR